MNATVTSCFKCAESTGRYLFWQATCKIYGDKYLEIILIKWSSQVAWQKATVACQTIVLTVFCMCMCNIFLKNGFCASQFSFNIYLFVLIYKCVRNMGVIYGIYLNLFFMDVHYLT